MTTHRGHDMGGVGREGDVERLPRFVRRATREAEVTDHSGRLDTASHHAKIQHACHAKQTQSRGRGWAETYQPTVRAAARSTHAFTAASRMHGKPSKSHREGGGRQTLAPVQLHEVVVAGVRVADNSTHGP